MPGQVHHPLRINRSLCGWFVFYCNISTSLQACQLTCKRRARRLTRSSELAFDNADVQLLSPQKPAKANLFPPITMSSVEFKAPRPYSAPLVGVGQQTVDSRTTLSAGHEVGMGIGIKSAIPEEEETEAEPVDSAMETYQTVHDVRFVYIVDVCIDIGT